MRVRICLLIILVSNGSLATETFSKAQRENYATELLEGLNHAGRENVANLYNLISLFAKNKCRSLFENLSLQCLHQEVANHCQEIKVTEQKRCRLLSDLVLVN